MLSPCHDGISCHRTNDHGGVRHVLGTVRGKQPLILCPSDVFRVSYLTPALTSLTVRTEMKTISAPPWTHFLIHFVFPAVGGLLGLGLSATPLPSVHALERRNKGLGTFNPLPACVFLVNSGLWMLYGVAIRDPFIYLANAPAALMSFHITLRTYPLASLSLRRYMEGILGLGIMCVAGVGGLYLFFPSASPPLSATLLPLPEKINGAMASGINVLLYASPLSTLMEVLRTRDTSSILLLWTFTAIGCSVTWAVYGAATGQISVMVPHAFGLLLNILQLLVKIIVSPPGGKPSARKRTRREAALDGRGEASEKIRAMEEGGGRVEGGAGVEMMEVVVLGGREKERPRPTTCPGAPREWRESAGGLSLSEGGDEKCWGEGKGDEDEGGWEAGEAGKEGGEAVEEAEEARRWLWGSSTGKVSTSQGRRHSKEAGSGHGKEGGGAGGRVGGEKSRAAAGRVSVRESLVPGDDDSGMLPHLRVPSTLPSPTASTASSSSSFSLRAALRPEMGRALGGWRDGTRKEGGKGRRKEVRRFRRVSSRTPLCMEGSGGSDEDLEEDGGGEGIPRGNHDADGEDRSDEVSIVLF